MGRLDHRLHSVHSDSHELVSDSDKGMGLPRYSVFGCQGRVLPSLLRSRKIRSPPLLVPRVVKTIASSHTALTSTDHGAAA